MPESNATLFPANHRAPPSPHRVFVLSFAYGTFDATFLLAFCAVAGAGGRFACGESVILSSG